MFSSSHKGYLQVASASILFGLIGIFITLITQMPLRSIIFYRLLIGLSGIILFLVCCSRLGELHLNEKKPYLFLLGLLHAATMLFYFFSVKNTTVSISVLLLYTAPIYVIILSPFILNEPITRNSLFALILSIIGVFLIIRPDSVFQDMDGKYILGLGAGLISGLFYACMIMVSRYLRDSYTGTAQATWGTMIILVIFLPYSTSLSYEVLLDNLHLLILIGLLPTAAGSILYFNGLMHIKAQNASIIGLLEPLSAVIFAFIILGQSITMTTLVGGLLILSSTLILSTEQPVKK
ncbi:MAG: DMT family transporter [Methanosarcinales archaeon]|nr:DMT family transporter [Methanosarcinales archaeon]